MGKVLNPLSKTDKSKKIFILKKYNNNFVRGKTISFIFTIFVHPNYSAVISKVKISIQYSVRTIHWLRMDRRFESAWNVPESEGMETEMIFFLKVRYFFDYDCICYWNVFCTMLS